MLIKQGKVCLEYFNLQLLDSVNVFSGFPGAQMVKNLPAIHKTWIWSPDQEDPLEKGMATHFSVLAYSCLENPTVRRAWWATVHGVEKSHSRLSDWQYV